MTAAYDYFRRFADKYLMLKNGAIYATGKAVEVEAETIAAVYGVPVEIHTYKGYPMVIPTVGVQ